MEEEVILLIDEMEHTRYGSITIPCCRICHEAECESRRTLEAPCACSGTVKYAHRECVQKWCNEKGNTICEICLQNYEPGYTAPSKKVQLLESITIRDSIEIQREDEIEEEEEEEEEELVAEGAVVDVACCDCEIYAADRRPSFFRSLALSLTLLLLLRDLLATCTKGTGDYPFTLLTILILRVSGIVLPVFIVFWTIAAVCKNIRNQNQYSGRNNERTEVDTEDRQLHLV